MSSCGTINGKECKVEEVVFNYLYQGRTKGLKADETFLVVEPVLNLCNPVGHYDINNGYKTKNERYVASWYGYLTYNIDKSIDEVKDRKFGNELIEKLPRDPGQTPTVRNRLARLGNGFELAKTDYTTSDMITKMKSVLGLGIPGGRSYNSNGLSFYWFGKYPGVGNEIAYNNVHKKFGFGIQAYWLKDQLPSGDPIDSYYINTNPTNPDPCEEPKATDEYDNTGDKTIIKTYIDLYRDSASGDYTQVINKKTYTRKQRTVVI